MQLPFRRILESARIHRLAFPLLLVDDTRGPLESDDQRIEIRLRRDCLRRLYLQKLLDQIEDEDQIEFIEEALDNLAFTEDLDRFDLFAVDPDAEMIDIEEDDEEQ